MIGLEPLAWITDPWTLIIVGVVAVLLFGKRLPEVGRSFGRGIAEFKKGLHDVQDELNKEPPAPPPAEPPQHRLRPPVEPPGTARVRSAVGRGTAGGRALAPLEEQRVVAGGKYRRDEYRYDRAPATIGRMRRSSTQLSTRAVAPRLRVRPRNCRASVAVAWTSRPPSLDRRAGYSALLGPPAESSGWQKRKNSVSQATCRRASTASLRHAPMSS
jgi:sec-independent protein translocase protein TatA